MADTTTNTLGTAGTTETAGATSSGGPPGPQLAAIETDPAGATEVEGGRGERPPAGPEDTQGENAEAGGSSSAASDRSDRYAAISGVLFWVLLFLTVALINDDIRETLGKNRVWVALAVGALLATLAVLGLRWYANKRGASARAGMVIGFGVPIFGALVATVLALPQDAQLVVLRSAFLLIVIFMPSVMWWLFVSTQRHSLLNEYLSNLDRLGLLGSADPGLPESTRQMRVSAYLQKFEANYVPIDPEFRSGVVKGDMRPTEREDLAGARMPLASTAVPVLLTLALLGIGWLLTLPPADIEDSDTFPRWLDALVPHPTPVTMAFLGAYFFTLQMIFRRYVRSDLRGSAYVSVVMRVILAVVGTWAVTEILEASDAGLDESQLLTIGFVIGVFPKVAWQIIQSLFSKVFQIVLPSLEAKIPLSELDGLTVWHEARLEEEDVENVPNMATADLVELLVSTRFAPGRLIDWVDQAILLTELGPGQGQSGNNGTRTARDKLAAYGIRNASTLLQAAKDAKERGKEEEFGQLLTDGDTGRSTIPALLVATCTHSNTRLVMRWRGLDDAEVASAPA
jgi:hypothetical protein